MSPSPASSDAMTGRTRAIEVRRESEFIEARERPVALSRTGLPGEIGGPVAFQLSPIFSPRFSPRFSPLSSFVTGHNPIVAGGWTTW
jgi:NAD(P)-dependent dehydrogenase (short-subunit alcohol dehydrogenase family)